MCFSLQVEGFFYRVRLPEMVLWHKTRRPWREVREVGEADLTNDATGLH